MISALRGRCPGPLDECGLFVREDITGPKNANSLAEAPVSAQMVALVALARWDSQHSLSPPLGSTPMGTDIPQADWKTDVTQARVKLGALRTFLRPPGVTFD